MTGKCIRPSNMQLLGQLKPSFVIFGGMSGFDAVALQRYLEREEVHKVHYVGNSSGIVYSAAAVLLFSKKAGMAMGLKPQNCIRPFANICFEPAMMLIYLVDVTEKLLKRAKMKFYDIDLFELKKVFASRWCYTIHAGL